MHHPQTHAMQQPVHQQPSPVEFAVETPTAGDAVLSLAEAHDCRRVRLLGYFGEASTPSMNCSSQRCS